MFKGWEFKDYLYAILSSGIYIYFKNKKKGKLYEMFPNIDKKFIDENQNFLLLLLDFYESDVERNKYIQQYKDKIILYSTNTNKFENDKNIINEIEKFLKQSYLNIIDLKDIDGILNIICMYKVPSYKSLITTLLINDSIEEFYNVYEKFNNTSLSNQLKYLIVPMYYYDKFENKSELFSDNDELFIQNINNIQNIYLFNEEADLFSEDKKNTPVNKTLKIIVNNTINEFITILNKYQEFELNKVMCYKLVPFVYKELKSKTLLYNAIDGILPFNDNNSLRLQIQKINFIYDKLNSSFNNVESPLINKIFSNLNSAQDTTINILGIYGRKHHYLNITYKFFNEIDKKSISYIAKSYLYLEIASAPSLLNNEKFKLISNLPTDSFLNKRKKYYNILFENIIGLDKNKIPDLFRYSVLRTLQYTDSEIENIMITLEFTLKHIDKYVEELEASDVNEAFIIHMAFKKDNNIEIFNNLLNNKKEISKSYENSFETVVINQLLNDTIGETNEMITQSLAEVNKKTSENNSQSEVSTDKEIDMINTKLQNNLSYISRNPNTPSSFEKIAENKILESKLIALFQKDNISNSDVNITKEIDMINTKLQNNLSYISRNPNTPSSFEKIAENALLNAKLIALSR